MVCKLLGLQSEVWLASFALWVTKPRRGQRSSSARGRPPSTMVNMRGHRQTSPAPPKKEVFRYGASTNLCCDETSPRPGGTIYLLYSSVFVHKTFLRIYFSTCIQTRLYPDTYTYSYTYAYIRAGTLCPPSTLDRFVWGAG